MLLSKKERAALQLVANGHTAASAAIELQTTLYAIEHALQRAHLKLSANDGVEGIVFGIQRGEINRPAPSESLQKAVQSLSGRERDVWELLAEGLEYAQIGKKLAIAATTVDSYLQNLYRKLGVHNRVHATFLYLQCEI